MKTNNKMSKGSEDRNIHPSNKSFDTPYRFKKLKLWSSSFIKDQEMKEYVHSNRKKLSQHLERIPIDMNIEKSLSLVDELNILHILMH